MLSNGHSLRSIVPALKVEVLGVVHVVVSALSEVARSYLKPILVFFVKIEILLRLLLSVLNMNVDHRLAPDIFHLSL